MAKEADKEMLDGLKEKGFLLTWGEDWGKGEIGVYGTVLRKVSGYCERDSIRLWTICIRGALVINVGYASWTAHRILLQFIPQCCPHCVKARNEVLVLR